MEPKRFMGYLERGSACELSILRMNNTLPITQIRIIEPMVFTDYPNEGIAFLIGFGINMQHPSKFQ
jgi:hypothetical protein